VKNKALSLGRLFIMDSEEDHEQLSLGSDEKVLMICCGQKQQLFDSTVDGE
jgi:hypothetical protein